MSTKIENIEKDQLKINNDDYVKVVEMGNVVELLYMSKRNTQQTIKMLPGGDRYVVMSGQCKGEIREVVHHTSRADQYKSLYRTFANIRAIINSNVTDIHNLRWITLTYAENMRDTKRLYTDFEKFNKRFQYYIKKLGFNKAEYIVVMEPQGRGAWHCHLLYIFDCKAPYIANETLASIWGNGFVTIKAIKENMDNLGAYLTAYLGDMDIQEITDNDLSIHTGDKVKSVEYEEDGEKKTKYYIKGGRLPLYPSNFNMYRCSRGVKRPIETMQPYEEAQKKVSAATKTFEKLVKVSDTDTNFETIISKAQYNLLRPNKSTL